MTNVETNQHIPVMLKEVVEFLRPALSEGSEKKFFDGTFGRGGHTSAMLKNFEGLKVTGFDQDPQAVEYAKTNYQQEIADQKLQIHHQNFSAFSAEKFGLFDGMLLDLGVSSPQLDQAQRGFSFYHDGPLDMRMNTEQEICAADLVHELEERELVELFQDFGEVRKPQRVVRAIVHDRKTEKFTTTRQLSELIARVDGWRKKGQHPATQYFLALRLKVNQELEVLAPALKNLILGLKPKGRLVVLTFHSLEDRIVKNVFRSTEELGSPVVKKVVIPTEEEQTQNPRSRSTKLRVFERG